MVYGVFSGYDEHLYTYDYGNNTKKRAEDMARVFGAGYYARELTADEYFQRLREILENRK